MIRIAVMIVSMSFVATVATASQTPPQGETYALIVSGIGKDPEDRAARDRVVRDLHSYLLEKAAVKPVRLTVLVSDANGTDMSTAERIDETIRTYASAMTPADRFVFYYIGQANAIAGSLRFNLPGPDITQEDLAKWFAEIRANTQLVVLDCPYAGVAAKALSRPGRVVILASTEQQACTPRFGLHFVPALSQSDSDANRDGSVSVLEAFATAAREIEQWYQSRQLLPTETPCMDDNADGRPAERPWRYEQDGGDGRLAAQFMLAVGGIRP